MVTSAHRVEVEVGADGPASAPLSGAPRSSRCGTWVQLWMIWQEVKSVAGRL
jgi:hypothetical protein